MLYKSTDSYSIKFYRWILYFQIIRTFSSSAPRGQLVKVSTNLSKNTLFNFYFLTFKYFFRLQFRCLVLKDAMQPLYIPPLLNKNNLMLLRKIYFDCKWDERKKSTFIFISNMFALYTLICIVIYKLFRHNATVRRIQ